MPSMADNIVLFLLALVLFGPKRLPKLAREVGKWIGEFRRASADFRMQMEDEMRVSEQAEKQKQIDTLIAANPAADPALIAEPEHPHTPAPVATEVVPLPKLAPVNPTDAQAGGAPAIATAGTLEMRPPSTGLPAARVQTAASAPEPEPVPSLGSLIDAIPVASAATEEPIVHG